MRLAYFTTEYPKASHTFIRREIAELERRGHEVLRIALKNGNDSKDAADDKESDRTYHLLAQSKAKMAASLAKVETMRPLRFKRAVEVAAKMSLPSERGIVKHMAYVVEAALLLDYVEKNKIDHVHVHFGTNSTSVARIMRTLGGPSYSFTVHGPDEFDSPRGHSLAGKIEDAAFVCAISHFGSSQLKRWARYEDWNKIHVIRCTVGDRFFDEYSPIDPTSNTFLSIGRLSAQKGQLLLLDAARKVRDEGHDFRLVLAGDGEMRSVVESRIDELGLKDRVTITGWIDENTVRKHIKASRVLVLPSFAEGLPVVIMEALAMGRPVVTTMIAGIPELVRDKESGFLVPAGSVDDLVRALKTAITSPVEVLDRMGKAGRERVREQHYTQTEGEKLESLFLKYTSA